MTLPDTLPAYDVHGGGALPGLLVQVSDCSGSGRLAGMYLALQYDLVDDYLDRRGEFRDEHLGLARAAHERGELALAGAFTEPADEALLVWSTDDRAVVEAFAASDPYVLNGLVRSWRVREWNVVVGG